MAINVSQAFHRTSANPVDESMALTKAQMLTVNDNLMPDYYFTICQDDGDIYMYDKSATPSVTTGKFSKLETGGGGGGGTGVVITETLTSSGWNSSNQQTLTFTGYTTDMGGVIGMPTNATTAQKEAFAEAIINVVAQNGNQLTFHCENVPSVNLPVTLYAGGSGGGSGSGVPAGGTTGQALVKKSNTDGDVEWKDTSNSVFEINYSNNAVNVTVAQLNAAYNAGKILKLIDNDDSDRIYTFIGKLGGPYWFITLYLNPRQELYVSHIALHEAAPGVTNWTVQRQVNVPIEDVQKTEMPIAASTYVDKIYQYIGATDANYTHGLFYTCVNNSGTYSWVPVDVQAAPGLNSDSIQDIISSADLSNYAVSNGITYSTSEQIIGRWIDGKPIYQKTITNTVPTFTPPSNSVLDPATLDIAMNCSVDVFVSVSGFIQTVAGNYVPFPFTETEKNVTYKESSSATILDSYSQTTAVFGRPNASTSIPNSIRVVNTNQNFNDRPLWVTAQYTKTTD